MVSRRGRPRMSTFARQVGTADLHTEDPQAWPQYIYIYIYIRVHIYVYIYIYIYTHIICIHLEYNAWSQRSGKHDGVVLSVHAEDPQTKHGHRIDVSTPPCRHDIYIYIYMNMYIHTHVCVCIHV